MKMESIITRIVGFLMLLLTVILFFMTTSERFASHWVGLAFLVASQVMFFFGTPLIGKSKPAHNSALLASGTTIIFAIYMGITLVLALLSGLFSNLFNFYIILQSTFIFVTLILALILYIFSHKVNKDIEKTLVDHEKQNQNASRNRHEE